jgi:hypothetical protein
MMVNPHLIDAQSSPANTYARGTLFASMLAIVGILLALISVTLAIFDRAPKELSLLVPAGLILLVGLTLLGKGKLGLWLMYLWLASDVWGFALTVRSALVSRTSNAVYEMEFDAIWLAIWLGIVVYFHHQRKEFKTWLGEFKHTDLPSPGLQD